MKKIFFIILIIGLIILMDLGNIRAQATSQIYANFKKLEYYILRIDELVKNFKDDRAGYFISQAKTELEQARRLLYQLDPPRVSLARIHMAKAKGLTDQAAKLVLRKPFGNLKSQLDNMINQAESMVSVAKSDEAYYLLNQAKKFRRWSYASFSDNKMVQGQEYYRISYFFARKCIEFLSAGSKRIPDEIREMDISIRQLLIQAEDLININTQQGLYRMLEEAQKYYEEALQMAEEGNQELALKRLILVKRFIYRIFDQAERTETKPETRIENNLYSLRSLLQTLQDEINEASNPNAAKLLNKAWQLLQEAELAFEDKNYQQVYMNISLSQRFANHVFRTMRDIKQDNSSDIQFRIGETQKLLDLQKEKVSDSKNKSLQMLYDEAEGILDRAQKFLEVNNTALAYQLLQAATRMTARIQRELRFSSIGDIEKISLENKYKRLQNMINQLENNRDFANEYEPVLMQLREFSQQADQFLQSGEYLLAEEYLNTALEQIKQYTTQWGNTTE